MPGLDLEKHFSLTSSGFIKEICEPILHSIGLTYFNYIKIYNDDCSRELLSSNPEWIKHFYKHALYETTETIAIEHFFSKEYFLWSEMDLQSPIYLHGRDFFNIDHGISFVIKRPGLTYLYIFATHRNHHNIYNVYIRDIELLRRFIHYFTDRAQVILKEVEQHKIYLPKKPNLDHAYRYDLGLSAQIKKQFFEKTKINRYFLLNESDNLYLTKRQAECATLFIKGYTSKQISRAMGVSHRTVEGYLHDIKHKVQDELQRVLSKDQLVKILRNSNLV